MSALAASTSVTKASPDALAFVVESAETTYAGGDVALAAGYLKAATGAAGDIPCGMAIATSQLGSSALETQSIDPSDTVLKAVPVSGASTIADVGKVVFISTDNPKADLTLTRPTRGYARGLIVKFNSATSFDVLLFGMTTMLAMQGVGQREIVELGTFANAALVTGNIVTAQIMRYHGKIISLHGLVQTAFTGSGGTADVNLEIGGTNVTGGVLTVSTAAGGTIGLTVDATAITAANEFNEGSVLDVEVANTGGTQTAGSVRLYMVCERLPGI